MLLSPVEVENLNKKLPKGYQYETVPVVKSIQISLPPKRERKKAALGDFVSPEGGVVDEKAGKIRKKPGPKKKEVPNREKCDLNGLSSDLHLQLPHFQFEKRIYQRKSWMKMRTLQWHVSSF